MGLFGSSSTTVVSSSVYNLAGDVNKRTNFLKSVVLSSILSPQTNSLGDDITTAYQNGPGIKLRSFASWAQNNYVDVVGQTAGSYATSLVFDPDILSAAMLPLFGLVQVQSYQVSGGDYTFWAEQYMLANHPDLMDTAWTADFAEATSTVTITLVGGAVESFVATNYSPDANYIYALYNTTQGEVDGPIVAGVTQILGVDDSFEDVTDWTTTSFTSTNELLPLNVVTTVVTVYADGRPDLTTSNTTTTQAPYIEAHGAYTKTTYKGLLPSGATSSEKDYLYQDQTAVAKTATSSNVTTGSDGDVATTITTTVATDTLLVQRTQRTDSQQITMASWGPAAMYMYQQGSGIPALDALFTAQTGTGIFLPFIPFRINGAMVADTMPTVYAASQKAFARATNGTYDSVLATIKSNTSLGDIDYAYAVFGVALNSPEVASLQYVYTFFKAMLLNQSVQTEAGWDEWKADILAANVTNTTWATWYTDQQTFGTPLYGTPEPPKATYTPQPSFNITIASNNLAVMDYHMELNWIVVTETTGIGVGKVGAISGDLWWTIDESDSFPVAYAFATLDYNYTQTVDTVSLWWQDSATTFRKLTFRGLTHRNLIYGGKSVDISAVDALNDTSESGFLVPVQEDIFAALSLPISTQMSTSCAYLMFNSYEVVTKPWYETGIFMVIVIIIVIVITVVTYGTGSVVGAGLFGSDAAVGGALGLTGTAALLAGAAINALAAVVVATVVEDVASDVIGGELGTIIGSIAAIVAVSYGTALANGSNVSFITEMTKAQNLISFTESGIQDYSKIIQQDTTDILTQTEQVQTNETTQEQNIESLWATNIGTDTVSFDPTQLTSSTIDSDTSNYTPETIQTFLQRTLMTGTDIAQMSFTLLLDYPDLSITTDLPLNLT